MMTKMAAIHSYMKVTMSFAYGVISLGSTAGASIVDDVIGIVEDVFG